MKTIILAGILILALSVSIGAIEPQPVSLETVEDQVQDLSLQIKEMAEQMRSLEERVREVEERLGDSFGSISPFNTIERRLDDLERDVKNLKR